MSTNPQQKPHADVIKAWKTKKRMEKEVYYLFINGGQIMRNAGRLLQNCQYQEGFLRAKIHFLQEVVRCHGPDAVVNFENGEFTLTNLT